MLPFPNRKGRHDEVLELDDEDLVLVEASPLAPEAIQSIRKSVASIKTESGPSIDIVFTPVDIEQEIAQPAPPPESVVVPISRSSRSSSPRLVWDANAENDVADECLASIAVETSKTRLSDPFLFSPVAPPARRERKDLSTSLKASATIPPPASSSAIVAVKIPKPSPPPRERERGNPFERQGEKAVWARKSGTNEVERGSLPSVFTRKTPFSPMPVQTVSSLPPPVVMPSEAPKASPTEAPKNEPTVILLRERPRGVWVFGSAAIGALCAVTAMHFLAPFTSPQSPPPPTVVAVPAPPPPPPTTVVAPPPPATTTAQPAAPIATVTLKPSAAAVVTFSDEQGVAIAKPAPKPKAAAPASKPAAVMVPDSATLAKVEPPPPPPPPKPKKPLTPAQELSEAQLKQSLMK